MLKFLFLLPLLVTGTPTELNVTEELPGKATDVSPLLISEKIPDISVQNLAGESVSVKDVVSSKPTVMLFYRGGWCPYCNAHLSAVAQVEKQILDLGYQIVGVSPDAPEKLKETMLEDSLSYQLYSDSKGDLMKGMGIAFKAQERHSMRLKRYSDGQNPGILPVPSMFVVDNKGIILFEYVSPDYKHRISAPMLISVLSELNEQ
ncbi:MAG: AhpC/TSA family protein [Bacteroidia bacterium]|nr:AhpC/TSA family protein [Bacteroidia bacterium]